MVWQLGWVDFDLGSSPGWWAATVAAYCPNRMVEHPKSKSTKPRYPEMADSVSCCGNGGYAARLASRIPSVLGSHLWYPPHRMIRCRRRQQHLPLPAAGLAAEDIFADKLGSNRLHGRMRGSSALRSRHPDIRGAYPHHAGKGTQVHT